MLPIAITDHEFGQFQRFIFEAAGISLAPAKKALVCGRLGRRLQHHALGSYRDYLDLLRSRAGAAEVQTAIDLLTTNETYFFREPRHFDVLRRQAAQRTVRTQPFRVWSAACSSGEEVYSIAMVLDDSLGAAPWEVLGSDISERVLQRARSAHYRALRTDGIPPAYLKRYCLRGIGAQQGTLLVARTLRERTRFSQINLNEMLPPGGPFDAIFLRNVMIYFDAATKRQVVARVLGQLKPGGLFFVGHSESLHDLNAPVRAVAPAVYRKS